MTPERNVVVAVNPATDALCGEWADDSRRCRYLVNLGRPDNAGLCVLTGQVVHRGERLAWCIGAEVHGSVQRPVPGGVEP